MSFRPHHQLSSLMLCSQEEALRFLSHPARAALQAATGHFRLMPEAVVAEQHRDVQLKMDDSVVLDLLEKSQKPVLPGVVVAHHSPRLAAETHCPVADAPRLGPSAEPVQCIALGSDQQLDIVWQLLAQTRSPRMAS